MPEHLPGAQDTPESTGAWAEELRQFAEPERQTPETEHNDAVPTEAIQRPEATYIFAFAHHAGSENGVKAAQALRKADILAIEHFGDTPQERARFEAVINNYLQPEPSPYAVAEVESLPDTPVNTFLKALYKELRGSGKPVRLIDVGDDFDLQHLYDEALNKWTSFKLGCDHDRIDNLRATLADSMTTLGRLNAQREHVIITQLKDLSAPDSATTKPRIGVMLGRVHTPVYHGLKRSGAEVERSFVNPPDSSMAERELAHYDETDQLMRQATLQGKEKLDPLLIDRFIVQRLLATKQLRAMPNPSEAAKQLVSNIPPAEIEHTLAQIDAARAASQDPDHYISSLHQEVAALDELYQRYSQAS
jgi:hypothetical protein